MKKTLDMLHLEKTLTEEEQLIWRTAYEFVENEFMPIITEHHPPGNFSPGNDSQDG